MTKAFEFKDHDGATKLVGDERGGLKLKYIHTMGELDEAEALNILRGLEFLRLYRGPNYLDVSFARRLHRNMFGEVWNWGGEIRTSEKNIGVAPYKVMTELKKLFDDLRFWIEHKTYPELEIVARFHHRLVWIHPFANGNGRWARVYTEYLCKRQGWPKPNWHAGEDPHERRHKYIEALRKADLKDFSALVEFIAPIQK